MKIQEAQQILHDNGFLMENITEDTISDILWDNLNTDTNTSIQGIRKVCEFLEYDLGKPIERASVKRIAETIVKLYNLGYESEKFHPNGQRKIELIDAKKAAEAIKANAIKAKTNNTYDYWIEVYFGDDDPAYDAINGLDKFRQYNVQKQWNDYIDDVKYSMVGDGCVRVEGNDKDFLNYLVQFISETDLDSVQGTKKSWSK
jgi:hypothetical protein